LRHQQRKRSADAADPQFEQRSEPHAPVLVRLGVLTLQLPRDSCQFGLRLAHGHARAQPAHHGPKARIARKILRRLLGKRHPAVRERRLLKRRRHDSDHLVRLLVEQQHPSDHLITPAEQPLPRGVTQQEDRRRRAAEVGIGEPAPAHRFHSENRQELRRHQSPGELLRRLPRRRIVEEVRPIRRQRGE
jgi:hypothetical protein